MTVTNIVVTGKSGAGKQPRIDVLTEQFGLKQLSTGNIFRSYLSTYKGLELDLDLETFWDADKGDFVSDETIGKALEGACQTKGTDLAEAILGLKATRFVDGGLFVPDNLTNALFEAAFAKEGGKGLVLDGYPRTLAQGEFLHALTEKLSSG